MSQMGARVWENRLDHRTCAQRYREKAIFWHKARLWLWICRLWGQGCRVKILPAAVLFSGRWIGLAPCQSGYSGGAGL